MRWDYPPLDINPVFPGLEDIIIITIIIIIIIIIFIIIIIIIIIFIILTSWYLNYNSFSASLQILS